VRRSRTLRSPYVSCNATLGVRWRGGIRLTSVSRTILVRVVRFDIGLRM